MLFDDNSISNFSLDSFIVSNITEANPIPLYEKQKWNI